jgi:hypothetical protein
MSILISYDQLEENGVNGRKKRRLSMQILAKTLTNGVRAWTIVDNVFGECHAPCTLKTSFVDFEIE